MSESSPARAGNRVLVVLDALPYGQAALEAAATLAAELQAELEGLFVENDELLRLAGLPFAAEVGYASPAPRRLDLAELEQTLRTRADEARRAVASTAGKVQVQWSFQVARGPTIRATLAAAAKVDFVILGLKGGSLAALGCRPAPARRGDGRPTLVLFDGSPAAARALDAAARLVSGERGKLIVLLAAGVSSAAETLRAAATRRMRELGMTETFDELPAGAPSELVAAAQRQHARCLVLNLDSPLLTQQVLEGLIDRLDLPLILVR